MSVRYSVSVLGIGIDISDVNLLISGHLGISTRAITVGYVILGLCICINWEGFGETGSGNI